MSAHSRDRRGKGAHLDALRLGLVLELLLRGVRGTLLAPLGFLRKVDVRLSSGFDVLERGGSALGAQAVNLGGQRRDGLVDALAEVAAGLWVAGELDAAKVAAVGKR